VQNVNVAGDVFFTRRAEALTTPWSAVVFRCRGLQKAGSASAVSAAREFPAPRGSFLGEWVMNSSATSANLLKQFEAA